MNVAWIAVRLSALSVVSFVTGCYSPVAALEDSLVFAPTPYPEGDWQPAELDYEDVEFEAADGTQLHAWYLPHPQPRAVVLFAHGNAGNLSHRAETVRLLRDRHELSVMIFDYRGYGRSEGTPDEEGILRDARAARNWLAQRERIPISEIVLMGRSLGGAVAVDLAVEKNPRGLVLISTFSSLPDVGARTIRWLPVRSLMRYQLDSRAKIVSYRGPLLQSHGDADRVIPFEIGRDLFDAANEPKQFIRIPGGRHNDFFTEDYHRALDTFIAALP